MSSCKEGGYEFTQGREGEFMSGREYEFVHGRQYSTSGRNFFLFFFKGFFEANFFKRSDIILLPCPSLSPRYCGKCPGRDQPETTSESESELRLLTRRERESLIEA
jgi:hypothetical protein